MLTETAIGNGGADMLESLPRVWEDEHGAHADAVAQFATTARAVPAPHWEQPLAVGKWSPAEVTAHVAEVYVVLRRELAGGAGMQVRGSALRRWLLRRFVFPHLLRGRPFPPGVRAPIETRPTAVIADQALAVANFQQLASAFIRELESRRARGEVQLTHAYFGRGPALHGLRMVTVHLQHHTRQVARAGT